MEPLDPTVQAIFDQAAVGIAQIGLDGAWRRANNRYCQMLGYSEAELLARTPQDIEHADDWAEVLAGRRRLLEGVMDLPPILSLNQLSQNWGQVQIYSARPS